MYAEHEHLRANLIETNVLRTAIVEVVDKEAKTRIRLHVGDDDRPVIALQDAQDRDRLYVTHDKNGRGLLILTGDDEGHRASIGLADDGRPEIRLSDCAGQLRAILYVEDSRPALIMYDADGRIRATMFLEEGGAPYLMLNNRDEESQVKITVPRDGSEGFVLEDREGLETVIPLSK